MRSNGPRLCIGLATALALAACGGGGGGVASSGTIAPPSPTPSPSPTPTPGISTADSAEYRASAAAVLAKTAYAYDRNITGRGVTIAVIDSGVARNSPEFAGRLSASSTGFTQTAKRCDTCALETFAPYSIDDRVGHGTAVAAVALAARDGSGTLGIAPDATLLALKIVAPDLSATGASVPEGSAPNPFLIAPALRYAVGKDAFVNVLALDGSATGTLASDLHTAMDQVRAADGLVVQSVPNSDDGGSGGIAQALVGNDRSNARWFLYAVAVDANGTPRVGNGTPGTLVDRTLAAAGNDIRTIDANGAAVTLSGNSFAAPAVAGAAALLKQYWPQLGGAAIARILLDTADDRGAPGADQVYGVGVLDVARAMQAQAPTASFAAAQITLARFSALTLSPPFGGAPALAARVDTMTVIDRYGRDFTMRGLGMRSTGSSLRVGSIVPVWLPDAPETSLWSAVRPLRPTALTFALGADQSLTLAANVAIDGGDGLRGAPLRTGGMTGITSAWTGAGWSASFSNGGSRDRRAMLRRITFGTPIGLGAEVMSFDERAQVLGAALGGTAARTVIATLTATRHVAGIPLRARLTASRTHTSGGSELLRLDRTLSGSAFALDAERPLLGGRATLALSSPLRLDRANALAVVPLSYDLMGATLSTMTTRIDLTPRAREWDMELGWSASLGGRGFLHLGLAHALDAGHVVGAHDTAGFVALTLR